MEHYLEQDVYNCKVSSFHHRCIKIEVSGSVTEDSLTGPMHAALLDATDVQSVVARPFLMRRALISLANKIYKDRYALIEQSNILIKQSAGSRLPCWWKYCKLYNYIVFIARLSYNL